MARNSENPNVHAASLEGQLGVLGAVVFGWPLRVPFEPQLLNLAELEQVPLRSDRFACCGGVNIDVPFDHVSERVFKHADVMALLRYDRVEGSDDSWSSKIFKFSFAYG